MRLKITSRCESFIDCWSQKAFIRYQIYVGDRFSFLIN